MNRYTVRAREDVIRDAEFPGDRAEVGIMWWEVWRDMQRTSYGWKGEWIDNFDTEAEAVAAARELNEHDDLRAHAADKFGKAKGQ